MKKKKNKTYVIHFCHNKDCNNCWLDEDLTHVKTFPPKWKYCKKCCEELDIKFNEQLPPKKKLQEEGDENI